MKRKDFAKSKKLQITQIKQSEFLSKKNFWTQLFLQENQGRKIASFSKHTESERTFTIFNYLF